MNGFLLLISGAKEFFFQLFWLYFRVKHLILADPWGFPEKPDDISQRYNIPIWVKAIAYMVQPFNPLWGVRAAGPFGKTNISNM